MKIPVGIMGYGNLGMAIENQLKNSEYFDLVAIFSRRKSDKTILFEDVCDYKDKIKILFLCVGSQNDLEKTALFLIKDFDIVECYDNHSRLESFHKKLDKIAVDSRHVALCSVGWDPGLFSLMRGLFKSLGLSPVTFWGKGTSQGHTQAIKNIDGVIDAVQFTIPDKEKIKAVKNGRVIENGKSLHQRLCLIVANKEKHKSIREKIVSMKDYFVGFKTKIKFVSREKLVKIKSFSHKGEVATVGNVANFSLNLSSNPEFTAKIMVAYAKALEIFARDGEFGVKTIFDVPFKNVLNESIYKFF
ncbi:MAG: diaminopimelate dehydrogenase [Clostridia bacterium]|nr:diaminopimelate dehydrogenase [Clostridia bacterium]